MTDTTDRTEYITAHVVLTPELLDQLRAEAKRRTMNVSTLVRQIVAEYFERAETA